MLKRTRACLQIFLILSIACSCSPEPTPTPSPTAAVEQPSSPPAPTSLPPEPTATPLATPTLEPTVSPINGILQRENPNPLYALAVKSSGDLEDNRLSVLAGGLTGGGWKPGQPWDYEWMAAQITSRGIKRFRVAIDNLDAGSPDLDWSIPQTTIDPSHDALITTLARQGVIMTYVLTFWDKDTWPGGVKAACPRFKDQAQIDRYLDFARFIVHHFKDRIRYYEIWNEPDGGACPQRIDPPDYVNLIRQAAPVIRREYPDAGIVVGATTYLGESESQKYLFEILNSDIMPLVDVISWHGMYGTSPEFDPLYYASYPALVEKIKQTARKNGFNGAFEADELTWFTLAGQNWDGWSKRYPDVNAAKYTARAIVMHLGMDVTVGIGSALIFDSGWKATPSVVQNLASILAGANPVSFPVKIDSQAQDVQIYTFTTARGEKLIAFWTNMTVKDDFSGLPADIILPGQPIRTAVGMDVLSGYRQELMTGDVDGALRIDGLFLKDYPTFILVAN